MDQQAEIDALREQLARTEYEVKAKYEDQIESAKSEVEILKAAVDGKVMNLQPGDLVLINASGHLLNRNPGLWMQLSKKYGCTFVAVPEGGMDAISKATDQMLESAGLRKINADEKSTRLEKLVQMEQEARIELATLGGGVVDGLYFDRLQLLVVVLMEAGTKARWLQEHPLKSFESKPEQGKTGILIG